MYVICSLSKNKYASKLDLRTILLEEQNLSMKVLNQYLNVVYFLSQNQNEIRNENKWKLKEDERIYIV